MFGLSTMAARSLRRKSCDIRAEIPSALWKASLGLDLSFQGRLMRGLLTSRHNSRQYFSEVSSRTQSPRGITPEFKPRWTQSSLPTATPQFKPKHCHMALIFFHIDTHHNLWLEVSMRGTAQDSVHNKLPCLSFA